MVLFVNTSKRDNHNYLFAILEEEGQQGNGRAKLPKVNIMRTSVGIKHQSHPTSMRIETNYSQHNYPSVLL